MLPKTTLGRSMFRKLHVFAGDKHPHTAQQPKPLKSDRNTRHGSDPELCTGRRKSAAARVYMQPGTGRITINERPIDEFFGPRRA